MHVVRGRVANLILRLSLQGSQSDCPEPLPLKIELQCHLHQARRTCMLNQSEVRPVAEGTIGIVELGVVKRIKDIQPKLSAQSLINSGVLLH